MNTPVVLRTLVLLALLAAPALPAAAAAIWYEDNNLGRGGGMPADFVSKFDRPETFSRASRHIRVYLMRANVLNRLDDAFIGSVFASYLRQHGIRLAINAGGATWAQAPGRARPFQRDLRLLQRLKDLGVEVHYVSLQSVLSKALRQGGRTVDYPMAKRIEDVVAYAKAVRPIFPQAEIGIIDALPTHGKDYRGPYRQLRDALAQAGLRLAYVHVDIPFEFPAEHRNGVTWQKLREVERYVEDDLGAQFGFFATSRTGGLVSSRAFHERVLAALDCYAGATGTPRDVVVASWFPHPKLTIPDDATGEEYPAMRTVLAVGMRLEALRQAGPAGTALRTHEPAWQTLCAAG